MTALRRLPRWLGAALDGARARLQALDAAARRRLVAACIAGLALLGIGAILLLQSPPTAGERERDSFLTRLVPSPEQFRERVSPEATEAARRLSIEEKVDQVMLLGFEGTSASAISRLPGDGRPGAVAVAEENYTGSEGLRRLIRSAQSRARRADEPPPLFFVSQEGGDLSALPDLPPDLTPADTASIDDAGEAALDSAKALERLGVNAVLGPVLDIGGLDGGALGVRAFSDDAREVARYARATVSAYVGEGVISAPLHFPGLGGAPTSTDEGPAQIGQTIDQLRRFDLLPFRVAIDAGAQAMVIGHGLYGSDDFAVPASASPFILNDLLRRELGFEGLAITDDLAAGAITISQASSEAAVASIAAGADMVRLSGPTLEQERTRDALLSAVRSRRISPKRLDDAVLRVLEAKRRAGLLERPRRAGGRGERPADERRGERRAPARRGPEPARPARPAAPAPPPERPPAPPATVPRISGLDEREGRPPGPGGAWPPRPREPEIPGVDEREGRPPGPGGARPRVRRPRPAPGFGSGRLGAPGTTQTVPGGTTTTAPGTRTLTVP